FGLVPAHSRLLSDRTGSLTRAKVRQFRAQLRLFQKRFPQIILSIFLTELPTGTAVGEFAFWMANRARFSSAEKVRSENRNLFLLIDLAGGAAALTSGYGLEKYVPEETLQNALQALAQKREEQDLAAGIEACIDSLSKDLRELAQDSADAGKKERPRGSETW
ncbi:MAG: hypothetical protein M3Y86_13075, partial [Verrucomicrobiota bacterium]|nr:hypothetical protein [Verrucomicrobiota bacterium]